MNPWRLLKIQPLVLCLILPISVFSAAAGATSAAPDEIRKLVDSYGCFSCHGLVHKQVGPGLAQIAERYRTDPAAAETLASRLRNGTVGRWGRLVMPRQPHMTEAESIILSRWVLARP